MIHTILGFLNRPQRQQVAQASGDLGYIVTSDLLSRPVIAPTREFVEHGDEAFKAVGHDGAFIDPRIVIRGKE